MADCATGGTAKSITVVILSHNRCADLRETLARYRNAPDWLEIIVVDNASTDGSADMVRSEFPRVRLIANVENRGTGGRNQGIAAAQAPVVVTLDDDSGIAAGLLPDIAGYFSAHAQVAAVGLRVLLADGSEEPWFVWLRRGDEEHGYRSPALMTCGAAFRRDAVLAVGGFWEPYQVYVEERDLCTRLIAAGHEVRYVPRWTAVHRRSPRVRSDARFVFMVTRNTVWYILRNFSWPVAAGKLLRWLARSCGLAWRSGELEAWLRGWYAGVAGCGPALATRQPVSRAQRAAVDGHFPA